MDYRHGVICVLITHTSNIGSCPPNADLGPHLWRRVLPPMLTKVEITLQGKFGITCNLKHERFSLWNSATKLTSWKDD